MEAFNVDLQNAAREEANRFLAQVAPLLQSAPPVETANQVREAISRCEQLQSSRTALRSDLELLTDPEDQILRATAASALDQLPTLEEDLRRRLARLNPGDPEGRVDLLALRDRLAEREARQELGVATDLEVPPYLDEKVSDPNVIGGLFMGIFGFGWTAFTTVHAIFMIGGMAKAFGWAALGLLAFYSIFFLVGFAMLAGAIKSFCTESIHLSGRSLTVTQKFLGLCWRKTYEISPSSRASVGTTTKRFRQSGDSDSVPTRVIVITSDQGKEINFADNASEARRTELVQSINAYLAAQSD